MQVIQVDNDLMHRACPLCQSAEIFRQGCLDYKGIVNFSSCEIELSRVPELWGCRQCHSGFVQNAVDAGRAKMLYSSGQAGDRWSTLSFNQTKTRKVVQRMGELFRHGGRVLDVGCNTGEMLDFAHELGCTTVGLEYSEKSREVLREKGHLTCQSFEEAEGKFDIISAFDLVEHLYDVPAFLDACHGKLTDGGKLVLLTGDIHAWSARLAGSHWWYAQYPEHIVFPSAQYLNGLSHFKVLSILKTYASVGYQRSALLGMAQYFKKKLQGRSYNGLPSLGPDHMLVVVSKA